MTEAEANNTLCVHVKGGFFFKGSTKSTFTGPIRKGLRLVLWGSSIRRASSIAFVDDSNIAMGTYGTCEIVILSPQSIDKKMKLEDEYNIGIPGLQLGTFTLHKILGQWQGKIPQPF
jgi:hypothetical protein